jgi:hypothetical protein
MAKAISRHPLTAEAQVVYDGKYRYCLMLEVFLDWHSNMHFEFIPEETAVNKERYKEILAHPQDAFH